MKIKVASIFLFFLGITNGILYSLFEINVNIVNQLIYVGMFFIFFPSNVNFGLLEQKWFNSRDLYIIVKKTLIYIALFAIFFIFLLKGLSVSSLFSRSRDFRQDMFAGDIPIYIRYFILFSSSILPFFIGCITGVIGRVRLFVFGGFSFFLVDGITDSRSSILAFMIGVLMSVVVFRKLRMRTVITILIGLLFSFFFILYGQGFDYETFALRGLSYFTVPPLLSDVIYKIDQPLFLGSFLEIFGWPFYAVFSVYPFNTNYEYEFYQLETGLPGNVLIPIHACFNNYIDSILVVILFLIHRFFNTIFLKKDPIFSLIVYLSLFGPMSLLLNPFLSEKGFFTFLVLIIIYKNHLNHFKNLCVES